IERIENAESSELLLAAIELAESTCVGVNGVLGTSLLNAVRTGAAPKVATRRRLPGVCTAIDHVRIAGTPVTVGILLRELASCSGVRVYDGDLFWGVVRVCSFHASSSGSSLSDLAVQLTDLTRVRGRRFGKRTAAHVLLIKGLEFEHVVADIRQMSP